MHEYFHQNQESFKLDQDQREAFKDPTQNERKKRIEIEVALESIATNWKEKNEQKGV